MQKYKAGYLILSELEIAILPTITDYSLGESYGNGRSIPEELENSLYARSLSGDLQSEDGLEEFYRSPNSHVVILNLI